MNSRVKIYVGLAFDLLDKVWQAVHHFAAYLELKKKHVQGTKAHSCMATRITKQYIYTHRVVHKYNHKLLQISSLHILAVPACHLQQICFLPQEDQSKDRSEHICTIGAMQSG